MEKTNQIKAYEEVSKALTNILRNSLDNDFRSQFYSLLNVTNTNDAQDVLKKKLKQFLKTKVVSKTTNKTKSKKPNTLPAILQDQRTRVSCKSSLQVEQTNNTNVESTEVLNTKQDEKTCIENENKEQVTDDEEVNIDDEFGFNAIHTFYSIPEELKSVEVQRVNIEDEFGFNSTDATCCSISESSLQVEQTNNTNVESTEVLNTKQDEKTCIENENKEQVTDDEEVNIDDEFGFNAIHTFYSIPEGCDITQSAASPSVLNVEADEIDFLLDFSKSVSSPISKNKNTKQDQEKHNSWKQVEDDDFGFYSSSERSIWSTSNEERNQVEGNTSLTNTEEMELNDLEIW